MKTRWMLTGIAMLCVAGWAFCDSIVVDGVAYDNVIVKESKSQYYVQLPLDGRTICAAKSDVKKEDVLITKDKAARQALVNEWEKMNALRPKAKDAEKNVPKHLAKPVETGGEHSPDPGQAVKEPEVSNATGAVEKTRSAAGGAVVETGTFSDEKGVKKLVARGNRQKDVGFEGRVEQQRANERAQRAADANAAAASGAGDEGGDGAVNDGSAISSDVPVSSNSVIVEP
jgi:hypothetical protein